MGKEISPFIINKCVELFQDTIFLVNEMNMNHHMDKKLQFDFLINSLRKRKRYTPWLKNEEDKKFRVCKRVLWIWK